MLFIIMVVITVYFNIKVIGDLNENLMKSKLENSHSWIVFIQYLCMEFHRSVRDDHMAIVETIESCK